MIHIFFPRQGVPIELDVGKPLLVFYITVMHIVLDFSESSCLCLIRGLYPLHGVHRRLLTPVDPGQMD